MNQIKTKIEEATAAAREKYSEREKERDRETVGNNRTEIENKVNPNEICCIYFAPR